MEIPLQCFRHGEKAKDGERRRTHRTVACFETSQLLARDITVSPVNSQPKSLEIPRIYNGGTNSPSHRIPRDPNLVCQSRKRSEHSAYWRWFRELSINTKRQITLVGAMYTHFVPSFSFMIILMIDNSNKTVLPLPVGAERYQYPYF